MVDLTVANLDAIMHEAQIVFPAVLIGIGAAVSLVKIIIRETKPKGEYIVLDKRLLGREIKIYYDPANYVRPKAHTSYHEQGASS